MSDETTPNLGLTKPDVGASDDTWGEKLNTNFDLLDAAIADALAIPPEYVTDAELTVILDGYISDAELATILTGYVSDGEFNEMTDDRVAALLQAGTNITITYNDVGNTLTIAAAGGNPSNANPIMDGVAAPGVAAPYSREDHVHPSDTAKADVATLAETIDDRVAALLVAGSNVTLTYNDAAGSLTIASTGGGGGASVTISDTPPGSPTAGNLWWESDTGNLYIYYNDGTSSQWIIVIGGGSAPVVAAAIKNYTINGAMMVSQENGSTAVTTTTSFPVDQFAVYNGGGGTFSAAQVASPTPGGSPNRLRYTVTAADAAVAAGDFAGIVTTLEGYRIADLRFGSSAAKTVTLRFGVKAPAGTYGVTIRNSGSSRTYIGEFTITAGEANTDVVKSIVFTGDLAGTWLTDNGVGLSIFWTLMGGTTLQTPAGVWTAGNFLCSSSQFNLFGTNGNIFELFDVGLYQGTSLPPYTVPDYATELAACQRYLQPILQGGTPMGVSGFRSGTAIIDTVIALRPPMRAAPVILHTTPTWNASAPSGNEMGGFGYTIGGFLTAVGALSFALNNASATMIQFRLSAGTSFSGSAGENALLYGGSTAAIFANARL